MANREKIYLMLKFVSTPIRKTRIHGRFSRTFVVEPAVRTPHRVYSKRSVAYGVQHKLIYAFNLSRVVNNSDEDRRVACKQRKLGFSERWSPPARLIKSETFPSRITTFHAEFAIPYAPTKRRWRNSINFNHSIGNDEKIIKKPCRIFYDTLTTLNYDVHERRCTPWLHHADWNLNLRKKERRPHAAAPFA